VEFIYELFPFCIPRLYFLKKARGLKCLEFGCGNGIALRQNMAVRPDLEFFGIDIKDFSKDLPKYISFIIYNGERLAFQNNCFDIIIVNHVLEHIQKPEIVLTELSRVAKKNGLIYIEVPNIRSLWGKPQGKYAGTVHFYDDPTHIHPYSQKKLAKMSKRCGLRTIKSGVSRNYLHLVTSPILLFAGIFMPSKLLYMYARNSLIGWSSYIILEK
jgi:ubiquinone/menaquinone biosynthesis C-methylase UbiE